MYKYSLLLLLAVIFAAVSFGQPAKQQKVFTQDIDNFWIAFDSIQTTKDSLQQLRMIQQLYIDKGSEGLRAFMKARDYTAALWIRLINRYPKFWASVRPNTLMVKQQAPSIEQSIIKFKTLYPSLRDAKMYFTVGGLRSGGTTWGSLVLIGTEIAAGDATTDVSEFPNKWLAGVFKEQSYKNIVRLNIHEYVHTQQKEGSKDLLSQAIKEGSCDYITELVMNVPLQTSYAKYGRLHEKELKESFKKEMFTTAYNKWLYNGSNAETMADLGYFMGYQICKSYYANAVNKEKAIREIIELDYSNSAAVEDFLKRSKYYMEAIDKEALLTSFRDKQPAVLNILPFSNGDSLVDAATKEMIFVFSKPMNTNGYSIDFSEKGKDLYPITNVVGYSGDKTSFTVKVDLKPNHAYEFIIADRSFHSAEGYPLLKDYTIQFRTKP